MSLREIAQHVEAVRYQLMLDALEAMKSNNELWNFDDDAWLVPVSVMDKFRGRSNGNASRDVKVDDRSYHGRPKRDRKIGIPVTSI